MFHKHRIFLKWNALFKDTNHDYDCSYFYLKKIKDIKTNRAKCRDREQTGLCLSIISHSIDLDHSQV